MQNVSTRDGTLHVEKIVINLGGVETHFGQNSNNFFDAEFRHPQNAADISGRNSEFLSVQFRGDHRREELRIVSFGDVSIGHTGMTRIVQDVNRFNPSDSVHTQ